jgi:hypothetical protein
MQNIETLSTQKQQPQQKKLIVEYIDETELGPNYQENYIIYHDEETNENYIIDYSQKYKYVIRKKQPQMTLNLNNNNSVTHSTSIIPSSTSQSDIMDSDDQNNSFQQETRYIYSYVDQAELSLIDIAKLTVNKNDLLAEYYMVDPLMPNKFCVILQDNWNENENLPYISENDVDLMNWIVNLEQNSNRKFIVDDRDNTRYYIIPTDYMKEFKSSWNKYYKNKINNNSINSDSFANTNRNAMIIDYVDEEELKTVDLLNVKIQKDESYNEYYIQNPTNINHRWIVLPANWNQKNYGNNPHYYIYEDEVNNKVNVIYKDAQKRRFIVIKKTNYKLYLVPKITDYRQSFKFKWSQIDQNLKKFNNSFKEKKIIKASKTVQTSSTAKNGKQLAIVELPSSPKTVQRQNSNSSNKNSLKTRQRSASIDKVQESRKLIPRVNNNNNSKIRMIDALVNSNDPEQQHNVEKPPLVPINKPQRSNSANNIIDEPVRSYSGRVKKTVYFDENVKVSYGENNATPIIAPLAVPLRLDRSFSPSAAATYQDQEQNPVRQENRAIGGAPPVKPREVKPMNVRLEFTNLDSKSNNVSIESNNKPSLQQQQQQKPFNYLNNNNNNHRTQSGNTIIRIKPQNGRPGHVIYTNSKI